MSDWDNEYRRSKRVYGTASAAEGRAEAAAARAEQVRAGQLINSALLSQRDTDLSASCFDRTEPEETDPTNQDVTEGSEGKDVAE